MLMFDEPAHLDLFSGIGGFALASNQAGFKTVGFCEIDSYCQAVLRKHWPGTPIHGDIRGIRGGDYCGISLLTGGFPCQPFSVAGRKRGKEDDRYLWPEMLRVIREARPRWIVGENVANIVNLALDQVHTDLEGEGYEVESVIIPACAVDAPHRRDRVWILAHSEHDGLPCTPNGGGVRTPVSEQSGGSNHTLNPAGTGEVSSPDSNVADSGRSGQGGHQRIGETGTKGLPGGHPPERGSHSRGEDVAHATTIHAQGLKKGQGKGEFGGGCRWLPEPGLGRVADGIPNRAHRLKGLGNAIVPQVAQEILRHIRTMV